MTNNSSKPLSAGLVVPVFLAVVFLGPIVLGPILYAALAPFHIPFHRCMDRAILVSALLAPLLFLPRLRLRAWWLDRRAGMPHFGLGWLAAFVSAQLMIGLYLAAVGFHSSGASVPRVLLTATVAATIVPILEETIFRGFLTTALVESTGRAIGWILGALVYTLAHFLKVPSDFPAPRVWWLSGASGMAAALAQLGHGDFLSFHGFDLFLVGLILGSIFLRVGRLWFCAGLHSGWIFILLSFTALTHPSKVPRMPWMGGDLLGSPLTSLVLVVTGLFLWRYYPPRCDEETGASDNLD